ncbi:MAG: hypothetical protein ACK5JR_13685 [Tropicimonas sp.]|uniref:hypothetical protein n=1 Tax=Tropicimonas sp. TaxID=2067044 RepID=UPI003A8C278C
MAAGVLGRPLAAGAPVCHWRLSEVTQAEYDTPHRPMAGQMDAQFFLTREKNFIPHEYPCRTAFAAARRGHRPVELPRREPERIWAPFGSPRVDLSGFWFRATELSAWADTEIEAAEAGPARLRLSCCGGAILWVNGVEAGFMSAYQRNFETAETFDVTLRQGANRITVFFDDLAERDTRYFFQLDYLDGPQAAVALPVGTDSTTAAAMEALLDEMHFDRPCYGSGEVALACRGTIGRDAALHVAVAGDFLAEEHDHFDLTLKDGAQRIVLGPVGQFHSDFRHFDISLTVDELTFSRPFTVEIAHLEAQGSPPETLPERIAEALGHVAHHGYADSSTALARLALALTGEVTEAMIAASLDRIEACHDCADFHLVPLLFARIRFGERIGAALRERIDCAILGFRYWMDEPGNDVQWYFSENHALLFHTSAYLGGHLLAGERFTRAGISGAEQSRLGAERLRAWFDHFERWEMAEFNSVPYFPIDLKGLLALSALAPDKDIRDRAASAVRRLIAIVAASSHHGVLTAAQGRSYEHTLMAARTSELSAMARVLWGRGNYGRVFQMLPELLLCLRDHGLEIPAALGEQAALTGGRKLEWVFSQGENAFAPLYHYKTSATAMGSLAHYRWGEWGYQETVLQLRIGADPDAQIWVNHPGEVIHAGFGRPSYWGGCGTIPRVHQYRDLAVVLFDTHPDTPDFTHIWFPAQVFDEVVEGGRVRVARKDGGLAFVMGTGDLIPVTDGPTAGMELRQRGRQTGWIFRLGQKMTVDDFATHFGGLEIAEGAGGWLELDDPDYGTVRFGPGGEIEAEGRRLDPADWPVSGLLTELS